MILRDYKHIVQIDFSKKEIVVLKETNLEYVINSVFSTITKYNSDNNRGIPLPYRVITDHDEVRDYILLEEGWIIVGEDRLDSNYAKICNKNEFIEELNKIICKKYGDDLIVRFKE